MNRIDKGFKHLKESEDNMNIMYKKVTIINNMKNKSKRKIETKEWWRNYHNECEYLCFKYHLGVLTFKQLYFMDLTIFLGMDNYYKGDKTTYNYMTVYGTLLKKYKSSKGIMRFIYYILLKFRLINIPQSEWSCNK